MLTTWELMDGLRPIFKEEINILKQKLNIDIPEETCWMSRMYIFSFDKNTKEKIILYKIKAKQMELTLHKDYQNLDKELLTWQDIIITEKENLESKEKESLKIIKDALNKYQNYKINICVSGGKDSTVISYLVRQIDSSIYNIFNNTTLDSAQTYKYLKSIYKTCIINPKKSFYNWIKKSNFIPTRLGRGCCRLFKEEPMYSSFDEKTKHLLFYGMKNSESFRRVDYKTEWRHKEWKTKNWIGILPIRKWTDSDVWLYILWKNLKFNEIYTYGYNRVGCIVACPFRTDYESILDKKYFPKLYDRWQKILYKDFIDNKKWPKINCSIEEYLKGAWKGVLFRKEPTKEVIVEFAKYKNLNYEVAEKYFNKKCSCGKKITINDAALSMKFFGRKINTFICIDCMSKIQGVTKKELLEKIEDFKQQGCDLF